MSNKLFVGSISFDLSNEELEELFKQHGEVVSAKIIVDRDSNRSRGFGFVEMGTGKEAQSAIDALNGTEVKGRAINVSIAKERTNNDRGGFKGKRNYDRY